MQMNLQWKIAAALMCFTGLTFAVQTGEPFLFKPPPACVPEMVRYLVDWGDGTVTPTAHGKSNFSPVVEKTYFQRGDFKIKPIAITMSGEQIQLPEKSISVGSSAVAAPPVLPAKRKEHTGVSGNQYEPQSIVLKFDAPSAISALILNKAPDAPFPENFSIEFSTDGGTVWYDIPSAVFNHIPDPGKNSVWIPLNNIMADAVRVVSYRVPETAHGKYQLRFGDIQAVKGETLFKMDLNPKLAADWNNMWLAFGSAKNEVLHHFDPWWPTDRPDEGGLLGIGSTIWAHWNSMKLSWLDDPASKKYLTGVWNKIPQDGQGLLGVAPNEFFHLGHSKHFVTPAIFISGVSDWYLMHRDPALLEMRDPSTGITLLEKLRNAMAYQLNELEGKSGVLIINDPEHDGTVNGKSGNYWDGWRFGYKSAYANLLFYQSLEWMARLEESFGNETPAAEYRALRPLVKQRYNEIFWVPETGRFTGCIGRDGTIQDYGFTFVNLEAVAGGIATDEHAEQILQWLDGSRIVAGDTSTGEDIYFWKVAPRANTLAAEAHTPSFWDGWTMEIGPDTIGEYGKQIQNGGHIFYVSYYDLMSRLRTRGIGDAMKRMDVILAEFHKDQLRRKPANKFGSTHVEGLLREFPESGLVPLFFIRGIMGIEPAVEGLRIAPALPDGWNFAEVSEFHFAGKKYKIRVERNIENASVKDFIVTVPADQPALLTPTGELIYVN